VARRYKRNFAEFKLTLDKTMYTERRWSRYYGLKPGEATLLMGLLRKAEAVFEPETVKAMTVAYDRVRKELGLSSTDDPLTAIVAEYVIEVGKRGQLDPDRLADLVLARMRL